MNPPTKTFNPELRKELENDLLSNKFDWLTLQGEKEPNKPVSDELLVTTFLLKGSGEDWTKLKNTFPSDVLLHFWIDKLIMNELFDSRHRRIAEFFFEIKNTVLFIRQHRMNQLENSEKYSGRGNSKQSGLLGC